MKPFQCRNLIKKPWAFIRVPYMNPTILGVIGPGFLNQVPTLGVEGLWFRFRVRVWGSGFGFTWRIRGLSKLGYKYLYLNYNPSY